MPKISKATESNDLELLGIKALIEAGRITKMVDLTKMSPTKLSKELKINYGRYMMKLAHPEKFTIGEIVRMADILGVDRQTLFSIASAKI